MLDEYSDYLQQILDAFGQILSIEVNQQDALTDHPFVDLYHAT
jgi:hypothetical protein